MPVWRSDTELPHSPGFSRRFGDHVGTARRHFLMKRVNAFHDHVCDVGVIAQLASRSLVWTFAQHHLEAIAREKAPTAALIIEVTRKAQHVHVELRRRS